jgi:plastocyanin
MKRKGISALALLAAAAAVAAACGGGGGGGPSAPAAPSGSAPSGGDVATIRITSTGVSPNSVRITVGSQVMFVNDDTRSHEMMSDPHPVHTGCPEINQVGDLGPGQSRMTATFNAARSCGFHDNRQDNVTALRGSIIVGQGGDTGPGY